MSAFVDPWTELTEMAIFFEDLGIQVEKQQFEAVTLVVSSITAVGMVLYVFFLKTLRGTDMDEVFINLYRLQATEALVTVFSQTATLWVSASDYLDAEQRIYVCRSLLTTALAFYLSFFFTLLMIAFTRCLYVVFPLYIHHLPKVVFHIAIGTGWIVYITSCAVILYKEEVLSLFLFYSCVGVSGKPLLEGKMLSMFTLLVSVTTLFLYMFILIMQYKLKVPQGHRNPMMRRQANLMTCMIYFGIQLLEIFAQLLMKLKRYGDPTPFFIGAVISFQAIIQVVVSPLILVFLMNRGRRNS